MPEQLDPNKYFTIAPQNKNKVLIAVVLALLVIVPPLMYFYYTMAIRRPSQTDKEITFEIQKGDSITEISKNLKDTGALNSEFLFSFYVRINRLGKNVQAGMYTVKAGSSVMDLAQLFQHGTNDVKVIFLEGWRIEEFARVASENFDNVNYKKFVTLAKPYEGRLFPDTYYFNKSITENELVEALKNTFDEKTKDILSNENLSKAGLTKDQAIILASIVEREAPNNKEDRNRVADILIKRWKEGMKLEADATTQYAVALTRLCPDVASVCTPTGDEMMVLNWWPSEITATDLSSTSPYNTRKVIGLPPAPISSVGLSSLEAVVNYKPTDYYFYLNDSKGVMHFAKTMQEHEKNINTYMSN
jgi:UPF0755 protein